MAKLFAKEKDIFLRVINFILVLWLITAVVITLAVGIQIVNRDKVLSYEDYSKKVCLLDKIPQEEIDLQTAQRNCRNNYKYEMKNIEKMNKANTNNFLIGLSNIVIVALFMNLLNKKAK